VTGQPEGEAGGPTVPPEEEVIGWVEPHPEVRTSFVFPRLQGLKVIAGEETEIVLGFKNTGHIPFNITVLEASLRYPQDFRYFIQNFTQSDWSITVGPLEEVSVSYFFTPNELIEPREFGFVADVYYWNTISDEEHKSTFFNGTVEIIEKEGTLDAQTFFSYSGGIALFGLLAYIGFKLAPNFRKKRGGKRAPVVEYGTVSTGKSSKTAADVAGNEWLKDTAAETLVKNRGAKNKKKT